MGECEVLGSERAAAADSARHQGEGRVASALSVRSQRLETTLDLLYVCACTLRGHNADAAALAAMDLPALWRLAQHHSLHCLAGPALSAAYDAGALPMATAEQAAQWRGAAPSVARRVMLFDAERSRIFAWLDSQNIAHAQLKGSVAKDLYPRLGLRYLADNDFWFDASGGAPERLRAFMLEGGYECETFAQGAHDAYHKLPLYNFEPHRVLFVEGGVVPAWHAYFNEAVRRAEPVAGTACELRLSEQDFYLHHICHAAKHLWGSGTGLRVLADEWVLMQKLLPGLDQAALAEELERLRVATLEGQLRQLAEAVFGAGRRVQASELGAEAIELLDALANSGTYGSVSQGVANKLQEGKRKQVRFPKAYFVLRRVVPTFDTARAGWPILNKYPAMYPLVLLARPFKLLTKQSRSKAKAEMKALKKLD